MKNFMSVALALTMVIGLSTIHDAGLAQAAAKYKITLGHVEPIHSSTQEAALKFKEMVEEESKGSMGFGRGR